MTKILWKILKHITFLVKVKNKSVITNHIKEGIIMNKKGMMKDLKDMIKTVKKTIKKSM